MAAYSSISIENECIHWLKAIILISAYKETMKESPARRAQLIFDYSKYVQKQMQQIVHQSRPNISRRSKRRQSSRNSLSSQNRSRSRSRNARYEHSNTSLINMMVNYMEQELRNLKDIMIQQYNHHYH